MSFLFWSFKKSQGTLYKIATNTVVVLLILEPKRKITAPAEQSQLHGMIGMHRLCSKCKKLECSLIFYNFSNMLWKEVL